ncbi:substrate-binding domain-containing protein [Nakamurella sp. YIM 132087]|uniref:Substrate-binding domain-containing protein n=1 Tax=Nakamurella alba TaxID=2665158 RepID=A0A7K1FTF1_9ACTN|nr:sugar ABC transporter substrate-binding protein [Nakamurella alba]MTD17401.1 substrate-binding domain-containing protein [Nakamurella alba]
MSDEQPGSHFPAGKIFKIDRRSFDRRTFLRSTGLVAGVMAFGGVAAACGSDETPAATTTPGTTASSAGTTSASAATSASSASETSGATSASEATSAASGAGAGMTIGISLNGINAYSGYVAEGVMKALEGTEYEVIGVQSNFDSSTELGNIQNLLSQGINGLVVLPADSTTIAKAAQLCADQGVAVGNGLWPGESDADQYFTGVANLDSVEGGKLIGEYLKANAKPGKVIVVQGIVGQGFSEKIDEGLDASLDGSGFEIVVREQGFFGRDQATKIVETGLQANPDATAVVAYSASMSDGIASYLKAQSIDTITHISSDADDEMFTYFGTPYLAAARYYSAAETGLVCAEAVRAKLEGGTPTFDNPIFQAMITDADADSVVAEHPYRYAEFEGKVSF